jgi:glyoxylase-like metal-dependent hydrolase (beta-lactamase superfamily II)
MAAERLGGLKRIILGHSHSDHRGTTPYLDAPVYCHPAEVPYAEAEDGWPDYWDHSKLEVAAVRWLYEHYLHLRRWDGEPVDVSGTVEEGDEVCGFRVIHFPGHAPGLIALWRESDRLALVSDLVYFVDSARLKPIDHPVVPHIAFNWDQEMACEAVRKLAELNPTKVCAGHSEPHSEPDLVDQLYRAAEEGLDRRAV